MRHRNPTPDRGNLSMDLRDLLNASAAIALDAKQAHWNVKGPSFSGLHRLFDEIHAAAVEYADLIGERLAQFGMKAVPRPGDSGLPRLEDANVSGHGQATAMAAELAMFSEMLHASAKIADEQGDVATLDILSEILRGSDKWLWMVESHLGVPDTRFNRGSEIDELFCPSCNEVMDARRDGSRACLRCVRRPGRRNPSAQAFQEERCSGCDRRIPSGVNAYLSDRFGGWFCSKPCERSLWRSRPSGLTQSGLDHFGIGRAQGATPAMGVKRVNPYPVEVIQPGFIQPNPCRRRNSTPVSAEELVLAIRRWWKAKEAEDWGDLSYDTRFWTPEEWARKGEGFGDKAPVNLTSEGGFNRILCYTEGRDQARLVEEWNRLIESLGWWWETNTCWAFSFHPKAPKAKNPRHNAACSRCGTDVAPGVACPRCEPSIEDMMRSSYRHHEGLRGTRRNATEKSWFGLPERGVDRSEFLRSEDGRRGRSITPGRDYIGPMDVEAYPATESGFQSLGRGKRRRSRHDGGTSGNPMRRNAVCFVCGATDAYKSPFSGRMECRVCDSAARRPQSTALGDAYEAAEAAINRGDMTAFERLATIWAHLLYGSRAAGEAAIAEAEASEGSRLDGLRVMVFG